MICLMTCAMVCLTEGKDEEVKRSAESELLGSHMTRAVTRSSRSARLLAGSFSTHKVQRYLRTRTTLLVTSAFAVLQYAEGLPRTVVNKS